MKEDTKDDGVFLCVLFQGGTNSNQNQTQHKLGCKHTILGLETVEGIPEKSCVGCCHFLIGLLERNRNQTCAADGRMHAALVNVNETEQDMPPC